MQQQYAVIREALDHEEQTALQCVTKEESRVLGGLEEKLSHLRSSLQSVQRGLNTLEGLADAKGDKCVQDQAFIVVRLMLRDKLFCSLFKYNVCWWITNNDTRSFVFPVFSLDRNTARLPSCK